MTLGGTEEIGGIDKSVRYIKLNLKKRATEWGYSLWEIEVFHQTEETEDKGG